MHKATNKHEPTIEGFGDEWSRFDQSMLDADEAELLFNKYFLLFPWASLPENAIGFDMGCGSGRWAKLVAPRVGTLHCIDPSSALFVAKKNLAQHGNCVFHQCSVDDSIFSSKSMDFGYSLGVLHHIPDTAAGIRSCVEFLKPGAPFLIYLYYAFDNRPTWFRWLWRISELFRLGVCRLPYNLRYLVSQFIALMVYLPLARFALALEKIGARETLVNLWPLSAYRSLSFYTMRTDALDRCGTQLEMRFTQIQIKSMMESAGLVNISFSETVPYWCAIGFKEK